MIFIGILVILAMIFFFVEGVRYAYSLAPNKRAKIALVALPALVVVSWISLKGLALFIGESDAARLVFSIAFVMLIFAIIPFALGSLIGALSGLVQGARR